MKTTVLKLKPAALLATTLAALLLAGCSRPPVDSVQRGYRGTGMVEIINPRTREELVQANMPPEALPAAPDVGPRASEVYENVQILGDLRVTEFVRLMTAMTSWVAPEQGCNYCHEGDNYASDEPYTKQVARLMISMTQSTNQDWQSHVGQTGVTCYTCHRGQPVPAKVWATDPGQPHARGIASARQNIASETVASTSLPYDPLTPFLLQDSDIRVVSDSALPMGSRKSIKQTEWTYGLMIHMSDSLGVNCTYCHNSRSFVDWEQSSPARATAWHAIRNVREMNNDYIGAATQYLPENRLGPLGDPLKVSCDTCHRGAYKPMFGARMLKDYPSLSRHSGEATKLAQAETQ